jgi:hypothetical protein
MTVHALYTGASPVKNLTVVVHSRKLFTPEEVVKHETAMRMLEVVLNSFQFKERMLQKKLVRTNGMTNAQVYELIMSGAEILDPSKDFEIDIWVEAYHKNNSVVGWTTPKIVWTYLNRKFLSAYVYAEIACNAFHEWLHKLGFGHVSAKDYDSVPYALGYLVEEMIKELVKGAVFTPIYQDSSVIVEAPVKPTPIPEAKKVLICRRTWRTLWIRKICEWEVP